MPPILVTLGCAMSIAPASISDWNPNTPATFSPAEMRNAALTHARKTAAIFRRKDRLFEPSQAVVAQSIRHLDRIGHRPGAIDVEHDAGTVDAGRILRRKHGFARDLMQLDMAIAPRASGGRVLRNKREIGVAQQARIGVSSVRSPLPPSRRYSGWPAFLPRISQSAISIPE